MIERDGPNGSMGDPFSGFWKLGAPERYDRLIALGVLTPNEVEILRQGAMLPPESAETMIENRIGIMEIPLGVAVGVPIDGRVYAVPIVGEESSVVAAVCSAAKLIRTQGGDVSTETLGNKAIGQVHFAHVDDFDAFEEKVESHRKALITDVNKKVLASMVERGGGVTDIEIRRIPHPDGTDVAVVHVIINTCDAMGANKVTTVCEYLREPLETITGEHVTMCILSNLADRRLTSAHIVVPDFDPVAGMAIEDASQLAQLDPYRAATHNKGVMNGIDSVVIATGNDWRAVEAGAHAYAARSGQYRGLSEWRMEGPDLVGDMTIPMAVGTVGGVTDIHPTAQLSLKMLGNPSADELARIITAVGLIQNLAALRALTSGGLIQGHMKLHATNLAAACGAESHEIEPLTAYLREVLATQGRVGQSDARIGLELLREQAQETQF